MTTLDWLLVIGLNLPIVLYALWRGRGVQSSSDWFLANRSLPWWVIGMSMYATMIDSSDMVVDAGGAYQFGIRMFVVNWVGVIAGWVLMAHVVALPMYRAGMYTNSEYLEARFGPAARVISVFVQVQFRTMVLGIMANTIFLTLTIVLGMNTVAAWTAVISIALLATIYTMAGGLEAVAVTDALQSLVMVLASIVIFVLVYRHIDGWSGLEARLAANDHTATAGILHTAEEHVETIDAAELTEIEIERHRQLGGEYFASSGTILNRTAPWLASLGFVLTGMSYSIVNHTQSMRMFGARSEWDFKMSAVLASAVVIVITFLNLSVGVIGRALYPDVASIPVAEELQRVDAVFPVLVRDLAFGGLRGIIVAGVMAASFSTFDSIGSTLSALLTRDVYGRLLVTDADDRHYLAVGRWLTPVIIFGSFLYLPLLNAGMFAFYMQMVAVFVTPLLTVYLMGTLTRVHRRAGTIGLLVGVAYGLWGLLAQYVFFDSGRLLLPAALMNSFVAGPMSLLVTAGAMVAVSLVWGWTPRGELIHEETTAWLRTSRQAVLSVDASHPQAKAASYLPLVLGLAVLAVGVFLSFVVFA